VIYSILSEATFVYCEKMDKKEFRVLMKHGFLAEKITVEANAWLDEHYTDSSPAKSTVEKWFAKFNRSEMSNEDDERLKKCFYRRKHQKSPQDSFE
jgi:(p)ppGpp synthase/HD superfamily hydrolase